MYYVCDYTVYMYVDAGKILSNNFFIKLEHRVIYRHYSILCTYIHVHVIYQECTCIC